MPKVRLRSGLPYRENTIIGPEIWVALLKRAEPVSTSQIETSVVFLQEKVEKVKTMAGLPPLNDPAAQAAANAAAGG